MVIKPIQNYDVFNLLFEDADQNHYALFMMLEDRDPYVLSYVFLKRAPDVWYKALWLFDKLCDLLSDNFAT